MLRQYLPEVKSTLPMVSNNKPSGGKAFESERDILYQVLFDMRQDMTELKRQVAALMGGEIPMSRSTTNYASHGEVSLLDSMQHPNTSALSIRSSKETDEFEYQDTEEYVEETLSIEDAEKELIRKALLRYGGKRKLAAQELKISERTLYRKIKEYNLEDL